MSSETFESCNMVAMNFVDLRHKRIKPITFNIPMHLQDLYPRAAPGRVVIMASKLRRRFENVTSSGQECNLGDSNEG